MVEFLKMPACYLGAFVAWMAAFGKVHPMLAFVAAMGWGVVLGHAWANRREQEGGRER